MKIFELVANLILLNTIFLLSCLPIFTIGSSIVALNYLGRKIITGDNVSIIKTYFRAWKTNFKIGIGIFLYQLIFSLFFYLYLMGIYNMPTEARLPPFILWCILLFVCLVIFHYAYAYAAYFDDKLSTTLRNSAKIGIWHIGWSILMVGIIIGIICLALWEALYLLVIILIFTFGGVALLGFIYAYIFARIFKKYINNGVDYADIDVASK